MRVVFCNFRPLRFRDVCRQQGEHAAERVYIVRGELQPATGDGMIVERRAKTLMADGDAGSLPPASREFEFQPPYTRLNQST